MRYLLGVLLFIFVLTEAEGQYGLDLRYSSNNYSNLTEHGDGGKLFGKSYEIGVDYWLRLGGYRIEFFPQLFFALATDNRIEDQPVDHSYKELGLQLNTHFYVFNFKEDCDCPTFSKRGNFFTKGFFVNVLTGINGQRQAVKLVKDNLEFSRNYWRMQFGTGLGLDLGVSDLITLTPYFNYVYGIANGLGSSTVADLRENELVDGAADGSALQFGLRVGFRPDYKPYRPKSFY